MCTTMCMYLWYCSHVARGTEGELIRTLLLSCGSNDDWFGYARFDGIVAHDQDPENKLCWFEVQYAIACLRLRRCLHSRVDNRVDRRA